MFSVPPLYLKNERRVQSHVKLEVSFTGEVDERGQCSTRLWAELSVDGLPRTYSKTGAGSTGLSLLHNGI
jgi:hypothetical protein